jgi:hypothetical protein
VYSTSVQKIHHQILWKVNPDSHAKHASPSAPALSQLSLWRRQGHCCCITAVDGVMLRTGYVNLTVRTFAMLFSVVRPRRIPLDLCIISLFMWDFLQFREEVIGLCELSSLGNKTCMNQGPGSGLLLYNNLWRFASLWERYQLDFWEVIRSKWKLSLSLGECKLCTHIGRIDGEVAEIPRMLQLSRFILGNSLCIITLTVSAHLKS